MSEIPTDFDGLFRDETRGGDETGPLSLLEGALAHLEPALLAVVSDAGLILASHRPTGSSLADLDWPEVQSLIDEAARLPHSPAPTVCSDSAPGRTLVTVSAASTEGRSLRLFAWLDRPQALEDGGALEMLSSVGRLAATAVDLAGTCRDAKSRVRHLRNEQIVLTASHNRSVAEMLRAREEQLRQEREYVVRLEAEVEHRSADLRSALDEAKLANEAKSTFLANMSHEIRTPMTAILGYADLLLDADLRRQERDEFVGIIRTNGEHLLQILNDILDFSKIEAQHLTLESIPFDVRALVDEVVALMRVRAEEKGIVLREELPEDLPRTIRSDPTRIRQILVNLIGNAVKFTEQGEVRVVVRHAGASQSSRLEIDVIDTGIGMTADKVNQLFEPFTQADSSTTRRFGGTGLGLAITWSLVRALGGDIKVDSEPERGSTFRVTILVSAEETEDAARGTAPGAHATGASSAAVSGSAPSGRKTVLLAEDNPDNRRLIKSVLERVGIDVELCENGAVAAARMSSLKKAGRPPDLVLMDVHMPKMDGFETTRLLRAGGFEGPVVALTANVRDGEWERCKAAGISDLLAKPIDRPRLVAVVQTWLRTPLGARGTPEEEAGAAAREPSRA
jgi:signal transduction histidine kinase/FixJ family two-component response regulator